jgi:hypothetical protein
MTNRRVGTPPNPSLLSPLLKHLFVGDVPLLYPMKNVGRQMEVELWLGTITLETKDLNLTPIMKNIILRLPDQAQEYVV